MKRILSSIVVAILLTLPVSAFCVSLGNYVELNNATEISNVTELRNVQDLGGLESETIAFIARVLADGGTVEDTNFLNSFIVDAKNNNYFSDIVAAYSPSWGVKGTTTASKLYSINGAATDLEQTTGSKQPTITAAAVNGRAGLVFDGISNMMQGTFTYTRPETIVMMGFKQITWTDADAFFDGVGTLFGGTVRQRTISPSVEIIVSGSAGGTNTDLGINTAAHLRLKVDAAAQALQIDGNAETTSAFAHAANMGGFTLGVRADDAAQFANINMSTTVLLDAAIDGDYAAKMTALYNFSKSAYGTP